MKEAGVAPARGMLGRGLQLLTGSRARALEAQATSRGVTSQRHNAVSNMLARRGSGLAEDLGKLPTSELSDADSLRAIHNSTRAGTFNQRAYGSSQRSARAAQAEHAAVGQARRTALQAVGTGALGVGAGAGLSGSAEPKTAGALNAANEFMANVAKTRAPARRVAQAARAAEAAPARAVQAVSGVRPSAPPAGMASTAGRSQAPISSTVPAPSRSAVIPPPAPAAEVVGRRPLLSTRTKVLAGAGAVGLGAGAAASHSSKEASELVKRAFGAAMLSGLKGAAGFAMTAGKSIAGAARTGGVAPAMQAAGNAGRAGMMRAGNFISQNPGAGTALVAAPALAAGYAAGRQ